MREMLGDRGWPAARLSLMRWRLRPRRMAMAPATLRLTLHSPGSPRRCRRGAPESPRGGWCPFSSRAAVRFKSPWKAEVTAEDVSDGPLRAETAVSTQAPWPRVLGHRVGDSRAQSAQTPGQVSSRRAPAELPKSGRRVASD